MHANQNRPHLALSPLPSLPFSSLGPLQSLLEKLPAPPLDCQSTQPLPALRRFEAPAAQQQHLQPDVSMRAHADVCEWSWYDVTDGRQ